jgi:hypothetical protein
MLDREKLTDVYDCHFEGYWLKEGSPWTKRIDRLYIEGRWILYIGLVETASQKWGAESIRNTAGLRLLDFPHCWTQTYRSLLSRYQSLPISQLILKNIKHSTCRSQSYHPISKQSSQLTVIFVQPRNAYTRVCKGLSWRRDQSIPW